MNEPQEFINKPNKSFISTISELSVLNNDYVMFIGLLFQISIGTMWTYGNIIPYIASYFAYYGTKENYTFADYYNDANWLFFQLFLMATIGCIIGGKVEIYFGPKIAISISSLCISFGFGLTYFTLKSHNIFLVYLSYGIVFGVGIGLGYPLLSLVAMRWFPDKQGTVCGLISGIFGGSPLLWDYLQTYFVNPWGIPIDPDYGYAMNQQIIERIPFMFVYIGIITFILQIISVIFVSNPTWYIPQNQVVIRKDSKNDLLEKSNVSMEQSQYDAGSITLSETLKTFRFWVLWFDNLLFTFVLMFVAAEWKEIAINFLRIDNDKLLSIIGSISALFNGIGRFCWGVIYDYNKSFPLSMGLLTLIVMVFLVFLCFIKSEYAFFVSICIIYSCVGCQFAFLPPCVADTFGAKHTGSIVGLFVWCDAPTALLVVICTKYYETAFGGWIGYILFVAACSFAATLLSLIFYIKTRISANEDDGNKIVDLDSNENVNKYKMELDAKGVTDKMEIINE